MIKLQIEDYCHDCPLFKPVSENLVDIRTADSYTAVKCSEATHCRDMVHYLDSVDAAGKLMKKERLEHEKNERKDLKVYIERLEIIANETHRCAGYANDTHDVANRFEATLANMRMHFNLGLKKSEDAK